MPPEPWRKCAFWSDGKHIAHRNVLLWIFNFNERPGIKNSARWHLITYWNGKHLNRPRYSILLTLVHRPILLIFRDTNVVLAT